MKKEQTKNNFIKDIIIIVLAGIFINAFCFFVGTIHSQAATGQGSSLPYLPNSYDNSLSRAELVDIIGTLSSAGVTLGDNYIVFRVYEYDWYTYNDYIQVPCYIIYDFSNINNFGGITYHNCTYQSFQFNNSSMYVTVGTNGSSGISKYTLRKKTIGTTYNGYYLLTNQNVSFEMFGDSSFTQVQNNYFEGEFNDKYPVYTTFILKDLNGNDVLSDFHSVSPETSDFVDSPLIDNVVNPIQPVLPTIEAPNIDSSQSLIDNINALFQWLGNLFKTLVSWVLTGIVNLFTNLLLNIKAFINAVITALNNGFSNIFNNFKTLFSVFFQSLQNFLDLLKQSQEDFYTFCKNRLTDISTVLNGLSQGMAKIAGFYDYPLYFIDKYGFFYNQDMVTSLINNSDFISSVTAFKSQASTLVNNFSNVSEPDHLSFTLDFTNAYYNFGVCEFSFDWILPFRNPIRLFVVGVTVLSMLTNFMEDFPAMFSGGGGHSKNTGK